MKTIFKLLTVVFALHTLSSCVEDEIFSQPDRAGAIEIDARDSYDVFASGTSPITFSLSSNTPWRIESSEQWCTVDPRLSSIAGLIADITISYEDNITYESRSAVVTITADDVVEPITITINQEAKGRLVVTQPLEIIGQSGGSVTFTVTSNNSWSIDPVSGVTISPMEGIGTGEAETVTVSALENEEAKRTFTLMVVSGATELPVSVVQDGFDLSFGELESAAVTYAGGDFEIPVSSTFDDWTVVCDDPDVVVVKGDGKAIATFPTVYRFGDKAFKFSLSAKSGSKEYTAAEDLTVTQSAFAGFGYGSTASNTINADGSVTITNYGDENRNQGRIDATIGMLPGTYAFKFKDVNSTLFQNYYLFGLQMWISGGGANNRNMMTKFDNTTGTFYQTVSDWIYSDTTPFTMVDTAQNDATEFVFEMTYIVDDTNTNMTMTLKINGNEVMSHGYASFWGATDITTPYEHTFYFGIAADQGTPAGTSMTIESIEFTPQY